MNIQSDLIEKYDLPVPRYTSYPTVPAWESKTLGSVRWKAEVQKSFLLLPDRSVSLYVHLPFCEKLCTYCGCNKKITNNHKVEAPYLEAVLKEWDLYKDLFGEQALIREIHLGGGTPTFFSPKHLSDLIKGLKKGAELASGAQLSIEVHPVVTLKEHLEVLAESGFTRLSVGIQDFDPVVQKLINRIQSIEETDRVIQEARNLGFKAMSVDLIYGLPAQTKNSIRMTIEAVKKMRPERISFYSYAHVPWKSPGQRLYDEKDLPLGNEKRELYETGRALLLSAGYREVGMDHFALEEDPLFTALTKGVLHRNFMGYTTEPQGLLIGLGASAISDTGTAFHQNEKDIRKYEDSIREGRIPCMNGHFLSNIDRHIRRKIMDIMCTFYCKDAIETERHRVLFTLLQEDGIVSLDGESLTVLPEGKMFLRNICAVLDERMQPVTEVSRPMFSRSV